MTKSEVESIVMSHGWSLNDVLEDSDGDIIDIEIKFTNREGDVVYYSLPVEVLYALRDAA